jgi:D-alanine-D-alanine ligase
MSETSPARPEDGRGILELTSRIAVFNPAEKACVEELWNEYLNRGEASGYHFLAYQDNGHVLGYACYGPHALTSGAFDLFWIAVDPDLRGRGVGHALMSQVEAEVQSAGGTLLMVETSGTPDYEPARRFYESCGYHSQAVIRDFYAAGDDLVIFTKYFPV